MSYSQQAEQLPAAIAAEIATSSTVSSGPSPSRGGARRPGAARTRTNLTASKNSTARSGDFARMATIPSPMNPLTRGTAPRQPVGVSGGYPSRVGGMNALEMKLELEQLQRETRRMKGMESELKVKMKREEEKQRLAEKEVDRKETLLARNEEAASMKEYVDHIKREKLVEDLAASKEHQESKRADKQDETRKEAEDIHETYMENKEYSEYRVQMRKAELAEWQRLPVEENTEKYKLMAEYKMAEQHREAEEIIANRELEERMFLQSKLEEARKEREEAIQDVEYLAGCTKLPLPSHQHLECTPK